MHWPATSKSSISCVKFDPVDAHSVGAGPLTVKAVFTTSQVYTSAYDCTIRHMSFTSGISEEVYATDDTLISGFDFSGDGHVMWISDNRRVTLSFRQLNISELTVPSEGD
jgi:hypothetical protein